MSIPETTTSPNTVGELNTIEQWRQKTNAIVNRLNSLYSSTNKLEVGNSIYADNLKIVDPNLSGSETILVGDTDGLIRKTNIPTSDLSALIGGSIAGNLNIGGIFHVTNTTESTNCDTGALMVDGGVGINKNLNVCGAITATGNVTGNQFIGDGSQLTNLPSQAGIWTAVSGGIHYSAGKVGIGVNPPAHELHIESTNGCKTLIKTTDTSTPELALQNSSNSGSLRLNADDLELISGSNIFLSGNTSNGRVGIGTSNPAVKLQVQSTGTGAENLVAFGNGTISNGLFIRTDDGNLQWGLATLNERDLIFETDQTRRMTISGVNGKVGIGTASPSESLDVVGNITVSGDIISTSDVSIKENVKPILNPIEKVKELSGYTFNRIGQDKRSVGLMAQDVEKVLPEAVSENGEGVKSLAYGNLVALLVETVKEQQKQIDELREKLDK